MADEKNGIKLWEQYAKKPTQELRESRFILATMLSMMIWLDMVYLVS